MTYILSTLFLFNNAGFAKFCSFEELSIKNSVNMIRLNYNGVVAMGLAYIPYMNIYSATKVFVRNYTRALNIELKEKRISVTVVCPGWMDTDFFNRAEIGAKRAINKFNGMVTPDKVAMKAVKDAKKGKDVSVYSAYVKICHVIANIFPQKIMMKIWLIQQKIKK